MRLRTVSLAGLMLAIVVAGIGLIALKDPHGLYASGAYTLALGSLVAALVGVAFGRGGVRAFWGGFAIVGWAYFLLSFGVAVEPPTARTWAGSWIRLGIAVSPASPAGQDEGPDLLTTRLLVLLHQNLPPVVGSVGQRIRVQWGGPNNYYPARILEAKQGQYLIHYEDGSATPDEWVGPNRVQAGGPRAFVQVGHCLLTPLLAWIGGRLALALRRSPQDRPGPPPTE